MQLILVASFHVTIYNITDQFVVQLIFWSFCRFMRYIFVLFFVLIFSDCTKKEYKYEGVDFYGENYQDCLKKARSRTAFTHEMMQEETLGHAINNCMAEYGWIMDGKELY